MSWSLLQTTTTKDGEGPVGSCVSNALSGAATGNLLVCFLQFATGGTADISTVTDNGTGATNTWTPVYARHVPTMPFRFAMYWCVNACTTGTVTAVTATLTTSDAMYYGISVREYSGNAASPADGGTSNYFATYENGTDVIYSGNITTTTAGDLIVGHGYKGDGIPSAGTDFGNFVHFNGWTQLIMEDRVQVSAGSIQSTVSISGMGGSGSNGLAGIGAFKPLAATGTISAVCNLTP